MLESQPDMRVVGEAADGPSAIAATRQLEPDVVIADLSMPGGGLEAIREINALGVATRVLVLTVHAEERYLLPVLASVFVGGTPTWGGIGTVAGGAIGAVTVSFIQTGVVAAGLSGFYVQFFNGLIIILSLLGHKWNQARYR